MKLKFMTHTPLLLVFFLLTGCQAQPMIEKPNRLPSTPKASLNLSDTWITPVTISYDPACLIESAKCEDLGQAQIGTGNNVLRVKLMPLSNDSENIAIRFFSGTGTSSIPEFKTPSHQKINPEWFKLTLWDNGSDLYLSRSSHEARPEYFVYHLTAPSAAWEKFNPWDLVKSKFPDQIEPPFSLEVGQDHLKVTEENYCCDTLHTDTPERNTSRMSYVLQKSYQADQPTYQIVATQSLSR